MFMRILGIDPGYALVGYGIIDYDSYNSKIVDYGVISTPKEETLPNRLFVIYKTLKKLIEIYKPDVVSVEELFYFKNQKTIIPVAEARGVIVLTCKECGLDVYEYTPLQIKQALTGVGRAEKAQVQFMVKTLLGLDSIPKPDDAADAVAAALCHAQTSSVLNFNKL